MANKIQVTSDTTFDQVPSAVVENVPIHSDLAYVEILDPESTDSLDGEDGSAGICIKCFTTANGKPGAGCLVLRRGGLPIQGWSPTQALTGPSVE